MMRNKPNPFFQSLKITSITVGLLWLVHLFQFLSYSDLGNWGIFPRTDFGLKGILFSPWIHGSWSHLISNTPPLFALMTLILFFYRRISFPAIFLIYFLTGSLVWVFGRQVFHIGASGVLYGLVAFVFWLGIFRRNVRSIALAILVGFYFGSMIFGIFPGQEGISWESHLLGAISGMITAFLFKNIEEEEDIASRNRKIELEKHDKVYFLPRETFDIPRQREGWFQSKTWS
jgi:membrane associated rhomboid family serine protease